MSDEAKQMWHNSFLFMQGNVTCESSKPGRKKKESVREKDKDCKERDSKLIDIQLPQSYDVIDPNEPVYCTCRFIIVVVASFAVSKMSVLFSCAQTRFVWEYGGV